jgi:uncharacterized protein YcfJ
MKRILVVASLAMGLALPLVVAPAAANASCEDRRVTGTVVGGVGGALIGHAIFGGVGGAVAGGLGGAVAGHAIAGEGCHRTYARDYRRSYSYGRDDRYASNAAYAGPPVYYDEYGRVVGQSQIASATPASNRGACATRMQSYYDSQGVLRQQSVQDCGR